MARDHRNILVLDIEWKPTNAFVWRPYKENVGPDQIIEHGGLLCAGVKWLGEKKVHVLTEWELGHEEMIRQVHEMMAEANGIITYNGDRYDLPKLAGEFVLYDLPPPPPVTSIDLFKTVRKFGLFMNKLAFVGPYFGLGAKVEHEGFALWLKVMAGDKNAQKRMIEYCKQDVILNEELYEKIGPYIRNHPRMAITEKEQCPHCEGKKTQRRGPRYTRCFKIQRLQCTSCGHWFDGQRQKISA